MIVKNKILNLEDALKLCNMKGITPENFREAASHIKDKFLILEDA
jgi:hypothetical protein